MTAHPRVATIVFVDEVHRFNKSQQDAFPAARRERAVHFHRRHHREPPPEVNSALLSRAAVYALQPLDEDDLGEILARAQSEQAQTAIEKKRKSA